MKYLIRCWKIDGREKTLVAEASYDSQEATANEIAYEAASIIQEAVETNG